jgi:hypothetical protein
MNVDKAFIQFAGLTAGRASSFFDFYAHDFEIIGQSLGSDVFSTNLLAYTATVGNGLSATISIEDPVFRRSPIYSPTINPTGAANISSLSNSGLLLGNSPVPVFIGYTGAVATRYSFIDAIERTRMPDFVGVLRLDQAWGSAQLSAAVHELNVGNVQNGAGTGTGSNISIPHANNTYGWAVQGGLKVNMPFIAPGDALYLQGAYGNGADVHRLLCVHRLLHAEHGHHPGPEVPAVLLGRGGQPVHRPAADLDQLHGRRLLPALLVAGVALGLLRLLWRAELLGRLSDRSGSGLRPDQPGWHQHLRFERRGRAGHPVLSAQPGAARHLPSFCGCQLDLVAG